MRRTPPRNEQLVQLSEGFESFYRREYPALVALAHAISGSRMAAEDLCQDALVKAFRDWSRVGSFDRPELWVRRVLINSSVSWWRRRGAETRALARLAVRRREPLPELEVQDREFWGAVGDLPKRQAQAVALYYVDDLPVLEVAEIMDCAEATVRVHLHRARQGLARKLDIDPHEGGEL